MTALAIQPGTVYGPLIAATDIEDAIQAVLQEWIGGYLFELERQHGLEVGALPEPRSWITSAQIEKFPEDQTPCVVITSPGTLDEPAADGRGLYRARWRIDIATQAVAGGNRIALRLARLYTAAMRAVAVQHQDAGLARRVDWLGESYDVLDSADDRTVCIGVCRLRVEAYDVTNRNTAPTDVETEPGPDSPTHPIAQTHDELIVKWPLAEPFPRGDQYAEES
jgi:hypothetical protein